MNNKDHKKTAFDFVEKLMEFSGNKIKKRDDLIFLIESALIQQKEKTLEEIFFTAKYITGLFRVVHSAADNPDIKNKDEISSDLALQITNLRNMIDDILSGSGHHYVKNFADKFLQMNGVAFIEFQELIEDLNWCKKFINVVKRI